MRKFIFDLVFGADEIAQRMFQLLNLRRAAVQRHAENKALQAELTAGEQTLTGLKSDYADTKEALEKAYRLELD